MPQAGIGLFKNQKRRQELRLDNSILKAVNYINKRVFSHPKLGMILGSGWVSPFKNLQPKESEVIPYEEIPNFIKTRTPGHKGELRVVRYKSRAVAILSGRVHFYEGLSLKDVSFSLRVLGTIGIKDIIITVSCGSLHKDFQQGDVAVIYDHINLMGDSPLVGEKNRFVDMNLCYDSGLKERFFALSKKAGIKLKKAIYVGVKGPNYETQAERRMMRILGGDLVGMSLVPEVIVCRALGIRVLALGGVVNMAGELSKEPIRHKKVIARAKEISERVSPLVKKFIEEM